MGVFSVCSAGAAGWAAGAGMLSFLDFFALKAEASYMRVHGQKRGTAAKKAVCYNRRSFSSCNPGWAGNFQNQAGRIPSEEPGNRRKAHLVIDIFHYSPICLRIQAFSTFFPCFFGKRRVVFRGTRARDILSGRSGTAPINTRTPHRSVRGLLVVQRRGLLFVQRSGICHWYTANERA